MFARVLRASSLCVESYPQCVPKYTERRGRTSHSFADAVAVLWAFAHTNRSVGEQAEGRWQMRGCGIDASTGQRRTKAESMSSTTYRSNRHLG
jgi:hypothetical protein